jgi:hypothetical protein
VADNVTVGGVNYSTDDVTTLNGTTIAAGTAQTQRMKVQYGDENVARDVSQAFPLPVNLASSAGNVAIVTGTLSVAATAPVASTATSTSQIVLDVSAMGNIGVGVSTAAFVGTLTFEVSPLTTPTATDWYTIDLNPLSATYPGGGVVAFNVAAQTNRMYEGGLFTPKWAKVRLSAFTSGTVGIALGAGPGWVESNPMLTASTALIGAVDPACATTGTTTSGTTSGTANTNTVAAAADTTRKGITIWNTHASAVLRIGYGTATTASLYSALVPANQGYEVPQAFAKLALNVSSATATVGYNLSVCV